MKNIEDFMNAHYSKISKLPLYSGSPKQVYIIAGTERTGSTVLCRLLSKTGIAGFPDEFLNPYGDPYILSEACECADFSIDRYIELTIAHNTTPNGVFGIKDFYTRFRNYDFPFDKYNPKYIYLSRENKLRQAVSYYKAMESQQWRSRDKPARELAEDDFSYKKIKKYMLRLTLEDEAWQRFFDQRGITPVRVIYEDFIKDMNGTVSRVLKEALNIDYPAEKVGEPQLEKQADKLSEYYYNRMLDESPPHSVELPNLLIIGLGA